MKFLDAEFVQGFIRMANDGWEQGWHEILIVKNGSQSEHRCHILQENIFW